MVKLSVVIPVYKMARMLPDALRSLQAQTFGDWEAIVVSDGDDASHEVAKEFAAQDHRVVPYKLPHCGQVAASNFGFRLARGEYSAFLAADDMWLWDFAERAVAVLDSNPATFGAYSDYIEWDEPRGLKWPKKKPKLTEDTLVRGYPVHLSCAVWRTFHDEPVFGPRYGQAPDLDFLFRALRWGGMVHIPKLLAVRRLHPQQMSRFWKYGATEVLRIVLRHAGPRAFVVRLWMYAKAVWAMRLKTFK